MNQKSLRTIALRSFVLVGVLGAAWQTHAQDSKTSYPSMAPLDQYLIADGLRYWPVWISADRWACAIPSALHALGNTSSV